MEVDQSEYGTFTVPTSVFDGSDITLKSIEELIRKLQDGKLQLKPSIPEGILARLRQAVIASPLVAEKHKKLIRP